jgi:hypothetical protein
MMNVRGETDSGRGEGGRRKGEREREGKKSEGGCRQVDGKRARG